MSMTWEEARIELQAMFGAEVNGLRVTTDAEGRLVYSMPRKKSKRRDRVDDQEVRSTAAE